MFPYFGVPTVSLKKILIAVFIKNVFLIKNIIKKIQELEVNNRFVIFYNFSNCHTLTIWKFPKQRKVLNLTYFRWNVSTNISYSLCQFNYIMSWSLDGTIQINPYICLIMWGAPSCWNQTSINSSPVFIIKFVELICYIEYFLKSASLTEFIL